MKHIITTISLAVAAAASLSASPMPAKADLLASNTVQAHYLGTMDIPCRHLTADCPDKCDHATKVARFRVLKNQDYQKPGKYGDDKMEPGSIVMVDIKKPTPGQDDEKLFDFIDKLKVGATVRFTQAHYYGDFGHSMLPFRPITHIEVEEKAPRVPATPAAPAGDYSVMPLAR